MFTDFYGDEAKNQEKKIKKSKKFETRPKDQSLKFSRIQNCGGWKSQFFWVGHFDFFLFVSSPWKSVNICNVARMGQNFDYYPGLQQ